MQKQLMAFKGYLTNEEIGVLSKNMDINNSDFKNKLSDGLLELINISDLEIQEELKELVENLDGDTDELVLIKTISSQAFNILNKTYLKIKNSEYYEEYKSKLKEFLNYDLDKGLEVCNKVENLFNNNEFLLNLMEIMEE